MTVPRRTFLAIGGGALATLSLPAAVRSAELEVIEMKGTPRGERIWFALRGLAVKVGASLRFNNNDPGNSHTATTYHPELFGRTRRIPKAATPWDSEFLLPDESYEVELTAPGVYDYYCIPHEMAAMVGRIVVGSPDDEGWEGPSTDTKDVSPEVLAALPDVDEILARHRIEPENGA